MAKNKRIKNKRSRKNKRGKNRKGKNTQANNEIANSEGTSNNASNNEQLWNESKQNIVDVKWSNKIHENALLNSGIPQKRMDGSDQEFQQNGSAIAVLRNKKIQLCSLTALLQRSQNSTMAMIGERQFYPMPTLARNNRMT